MKFGAHAFIWEAEYSDEIAARLIENARRVGLDLLEIPLLDPGTFDPSAVRGLAEGSGVELSFSLGLPADRTLPERPREAERFLREVLDKVAETGSHTLTGVLYGTLGELTGRAPTEDDYAVIASTLSTVAKHAAAAGISLCLEPVNRYETFLVNTAAQGLKLIERIGEPNVYLHLDTYHMNIEEKGFADPIRRAGNRLRYIHLSESDRGTPGTGNVHWDEVFTGLRDVGYDGALVMESFVAVNKDIARATCMWRKVAPDSDTLIRDGLAYLQGLARKYGLR